MFAVTDSRCTSDPSAPAGAWRHDTSIAIALLPAEHRGVDLVASASDAQAIAGTIAYGGKALEDEDVDVFACDGGAWSRLGTARTDGEGHFSLATTLAVGMRDVFASVVGDRTGARMLAYVGPDASPIVVSDVDGTLTSSENAFALALGGNVGAQPGAATALADLASRGYPVVYLTARGAQYTDATRGWLAANGFPRGPLRLAPDLVTLPGDDTIAFKTAALQALDASLPIEAGIGNRDSDVTAYTSAGISFDRIFVVLPEFAAELTADLGSGKAVAIRDYASWQASFVDALPSR